MIAKAIVCSEEQQFELLEVTVADVGDRDVAVRAEYTGISVGTEFALVRKKISWGPYPIVTGYQGVGQIEEAGKDVTEFKAGDWVYYRDNRSIVLPDGTQHLIVEDSDADHVATAEQAYQAGELGRPHLDNIKSQCLKNISSLAFGGSNLRTAYIGCLLGDSIAAFESPVAGMPPPHWNYDLGPLAGALS